MFFFDYNAEFYWPLSYSHFKLPVFVSTCIATLRHYYRSLLIDKVIGNTTLREHVSSLNSKEEPAKGLKLI